MREEARKGLRAGWYCTGSVAEIQGTAEVAGLDGNIRIESAGPVWRCVERVGMDERSLVVREALGALWIWHPGQRGNCTTPTSTFPLEGFDGFEVAALPPRSVSTPIERAFCDYFDHWHTRSIHGIPVRDSECWFENDRCGVEWRARMTPLHARDGLLGRLRFIPSRSKATIYGLGLAIDELSHAGLSFMNVQANTPVHGGHFEMRVFLATKPLAGQRRITRQLLKFIISRIDREIERDIHYWKECETQVQPIDFESRRDIARFRDWCAQLG